LKYNEIVSLRLKKIHEDPLALCLPSALMGASLEGFFFGLDLGLPLVPRGDKRPKGIDQKNLSLIGMSSLDFKQILSYYQFVFAS